jgi:hypothetical protein
LGRTAFRQEIEQLLNFGEENDWETVAHALREAGKKILGVSSGRNKTDKESKWWNQQVQEAVKIKKLAWKDLAN